MNTKNDLYKLLIQEVVQVTDYLCLQHYFCFILPCNPLRRTSSYRINHLLNNIFMAHIEMHFTRVLDSNSIVIQ